MTTQLDEPKQMGRPKRAIKTTSIRVEEDAVDLVNKAATFLGETAVDYASRVLREQARVDLKAGAEKYLRELEGDEPPVKKTPRGK